jgi:hypothetical protein
MAVGPGKLKLAGGIGGVLVCCASGVVVASNPKPGDAPLRPPVDPSAPLSRQVVTPSAAPSLVIPQSTACDPAGAAPGSGKPAKGKVAGPSPSCRATASTGLSRDPAIMPSVVDAAPTAVPTTQSTVS